MRDREIVKERERERERERMSDKENRRHTKEIGQSFDRGSGVFKRIRGVFIKTSGVFIKTSGVRCLKERNFDCFRKCT